MSSRCQHSRDDPAPRWLPSLLVADRLINNNNPVHTAQTTQLLKSLDLPEHFRSQQSREGPTNIFLDKTKFN